MSDDCPPPKMTTNADGTTKWEAHCWKCIPRVVSLNDPPRQPPEPSPKGAPRWQARALAQFVYEHCQGFGHNLDWLVENFSGGNITAAKTPEEFRRRLNNLYVIMPKVRKLVKELTKGKMHVPGQFRAKGLRPDGWPNHQAWLQVLPCREVEAVVG